jgi:hypothetical protein
MRFALCDICLQPIRGEILSFSLTGEERVYDVGPCCANKPFDRKQLVVVPVLVFPAQMKGF